MKRLLFAALALAMLATPSAHGAPVTLRETCHALADAGESMAQLRDAGRPLDEALTILDTVYDMQPADVQDQRLAMMAATVYIYSAREWTPRELYHKLYRTCMDKARTDRQAAP